MNFEKGQLIMTVAINNEIADNEEFAKFILETLARYGRGDWGNLGEDDKRLNDDAVATGQDRILAAYEWQGEKLYVITEMDRSMTTVMYASEY